MRITSITDSAGAYCLGVIAAFYNAVLVWASPALSLEFRITGAFLLIGAGLACAFGFADEMLHAQED